MTDNVGMAIEITFCICNTEGREVLMRAIAAVQKERAGLDFETEVLVLDNGSDDGSAAAVRELGGDIGLIEIAERRVEGRQRQRADGALARALLPAAERGLGAPAGCRPRAP